MSNKRIVVRRINTLSIAIAMLAVVILGLTALIYRETDANPTPPAEGCAHTPQVLAASTGWRFRTDKDDAGLTDRWFDPNKDDREWLDSAPGKEWAPEYVGIAWYRATFILPKEWDAAYLGVGQVDDTAQLWVNGVLSDWDPLKGATSQIVPLIGDKPLQVTLRVVNLGGPGGIKQPVLIGKDPWSVLPPEGYLRWLAASHPDWPMPGWATGGYYAWTLTGLPGLEDRVLLDSGGAIAPWPAAPMVNLWLYDPTTAAISMAKPSLSLQDGSLPIPQTKSVASGLEVATTLFKDREGATTQWKAVVTNQSGGVRNGTLLVVVRPLGFDRTLHPIFSVAANQNGAITVDGQKFLETVPKAGRAGVGSLGDVMEEVKLGNVPQLQSLACVPQGDGAAALAFPVHLEAGSSYSLSLAFPYKPGMEIAVGGEKTLEETRSIWRGVLVTDGIVVPEQIIADAYRASLGYLLLAQSPMGPRPGPLEHAKVWVRDAAYIGEALIGAGQVALVQQYLPKLFEHQEVNGRIPPIIGPNGPEAVEEWDSQGQAIFLVSDIYRHTRDKSFLSAWEPKVKRSADFLRLLRRHTASEPAAFRGLLPPSKSAEDLGPDDWHHYWDDFWGVVGFEEAAFIENELGNIDDARRFAADAEDLRQSILSSVTAVMGADPKYIPGAPEDTTSSAMARSTSVALYPIEVFRGDDPLIVRSFNEYYARFIAPSDGGYTHIWGQWWPYGGLGLARDYLRIGRQDIVHQILAWTLMHQTLPGTYAWAEQVNPATGGISGGDMPHAWAAATYISLIRDMLVMRRDDHIQLFAGVPASWLSRGKSVGVRSAPTAFGDLTAIMSSDLEIVGDAWKGSLTLKVSGTAQPSGGFRWKLPKLPDRMEGTSGFVITDGWLVVPTSGGTIKLDYDLP